MKRTVRILALVLLVAMAVTALSACSGRLSGTWVDQEGNSVAFNGTAFTITYGALQMQGTYEIKKVGADYRILLLQEKQINNGVVTTLTSPQYIGSANGLEFRRGEGYIWIDQTKYEKN